MTDRNIYAHGGWILEKVSTLTCVPDFHCGDNELHQYFTRDSIEYRKELLTQSYRFYAEEAPNFTVALVDFCNDALFKESLSGRDRRQIRNAKRVALHSFPAMKITRLGVRDEMHGKGVGSHLLDAIKLFFLTENRTGCRFLTVDAYQHAARFYLKNHFRQMLEKEDIQKSFAEQDIEIEASMADQEEAPHQRTIPLFFDLKSLLDPQTGKLRS